MRGLWQRLKPTRETTDRRASSRYRCEVTPLEGRQLMAINAAVPTGPPITAVATPQILRNNGGLIAVKITGTFHQGLVSFIEAKPPVVSEPPPSQMFYIKRNLLQRAKITPVRIEVTDQYREYQPRVVATVHLVESKFYFYPPSKTYVANEQLVRSYTYSATVYLQAKANTGTNGRRYTVAVSVADSDNGAGVNFAVVVPPGTPPPAHKA
jgi:hypothetical protein